MSMPGAVSNQIEPNARIGFNQVISTALASSPADAAEAMALANEDYKASMAYKLDQSRIEVEQTKADNENTDSARKAYVSIQESANAGWLAKNIQPMLAIAIIIAAVCGPLFTYAAPKMDETSKQVLNNCVTSMYNLAMLVLGFYFGSSKRDKDHDKALLNAQPPGQ